MEEENAGAPKHTPQQPGSALLSIKGSNKAGG